MMLEQLDNHMQKMNLAPDLKPFTQIHPKWIIDWIDDTKL